MDGTIRTALKKRGAKQSDIAAKAGISTAYLSDILNGKRRGTEEVRRRIRDATAAYLSAGELAALGCAAVPFADGLNVAAGVGATADDRGLAELNRQLAAESSYVRIPPLDNEVDEPVVVYAPALVRTLGRDRAGTALTNGDLEHLRAFRVGGDSMEPLLAKGGLVVVDMRRNDAAHIENGAPYVLTTEPESGEFKAKRLSWVEKGHTVAIESENKAYKTEYRRVEEITILGKIIWAWRDTF